MSHNHHQHKFHPAALEEDISRSLELSPSETSLEFSSSSVLVNKGEAFVLAAESVTADDKPTDGDDGSCFNHCGEEEEEEEFSALFWELLMYIPVLLVQSVFGTFHIFRSFVLGHAVRWLLQQRQELQQHHHHPWEAAILRHMERNAWPPPGLILLALLTITALVVHPDGLTWVVLRHVRSAIMWLIRASCTCWSMLLHEHGAIISTCFALATFASLFFLAFLLHKTLAPRQPSAPKSSNPTKKKKRKRGHRASGRSSRSTQQHQRQSRSRSKSRNRESNDERIHDDPSSRAATEDCSSTTETKPSLPAVVEDKVEPVKQQQLTSSSLEGAVSRNRTMSASSVEESIASASVGAQSWEEGRSTPVPLALPLSCTTSPTNTANTSPTPSLTTIATTASETRTRNYSRPRAPPRRTPSNNSNARKNQNRRRGGIGNAVGGTGVGGASSKGKESKQDSRPFQRSKMGVDRSPHAPPAVRSPPRITSLATTGQGFKTQSPMVNTKQKPSSSLDDGSTVASAAMQTTQRIGVEPRVEPMTTGPRQSRPAAYSYHCAASSTPVRPRPPPPPGLPPIPQFEQSPLAHFGALNYLPHQQQRQYSVEQSPGGSVPLQPPELYAPSLPPSAFSDSQSYQYQRGVSPKPMQQQNQHARFDPPDGDPRMPSRQSGFSSGIATTYVVDGTAFEVQTRRQVPSRVPANPFATEDDEIPVGSTSNQDTDDDRIEAELQELGGRMVGSILDF